VKFLWGELEYLLTKLHKISKFDLNYTTTCKQLHHSWEMLVHSYRRYVPYGVAVIHATSTKREMFPILGQINLVHTLLTVTLRCISV